MAFRFAILYRRRQPEARCGRGASLCICVMWVFVCLLVCYVVQYRACARWGIHSTSNAIAIWCKLSLIASRNRTSGRGLTSNAYHRETLQPNNPVHPDWKLRERNERKRDIHVQQQLKAKWCFIRWFFCLFAFFVVVVVAAVLQWATLWPVPPARNISMCIK